MPRAKKTAAAETAEIKETVAAAAPVEENKADEKKASAKKTAEKKTPAKKETAEERKVVIQYNGAEIAGTELVEKSKADAGVKSAKSVVVYVRPEINKVYYVIDEEIFGNFDLF